MEITKRQQMKVNEIAKSHNVKLMVVFGSQIQGKTHAGSDLDIGVLFRKPPHGYGPLLSLQYNLKDVFSDHKLDVRYLHKSSPYFLFNAVYKGQLLYGSSYDYAKEAGRAFKLFAESHKLRNLRDEMIERRQFELLSQKT